MISSKLSFRVLELLKSGIMSSDVCATRRQGLAYCHFFLFHRLSSFAFAAALQAIRFQDSHETFSVVKRCNLIHLKSNHNKASWLTRKKSLAETRGCNQGTLPDNWRKITLFRIIVRSFQSSPQRAIAV